MMLIFKGKIRVVLLTSLLFILFGCGFTRLLDFGNAACDFAVSPNGPLIELDLVASGFEKPVYVTDAGDGTRRLFVAEKGGTIQTIENGRALPSPFLDIVDRTLSDVTDPDAIWEQGLLGLAFHPNFAQNGRFYVYYTARVDGRSIIAEFQANVNRDAADPSSEKVLLEVQQPTAFHNGGQLAFGPDGFLYIGLGDGQVRRNGQDMATLLGTVLRIDVDRESPYAIPRDNPFVGTPQAREEIWAYGLRNPWRFSFDRCNQNLFLGDVGNTGFEEINLIERGGNYGWAIMEGIQCFPPGDRRTDCFEPGLSLPIMVYPHGPGCTSITGGYVYRGHLYPNLNGYYFFADFCSGEIYAAYETSSSWKKVSLLESGIMISSFGEDQDGELYVVGYEDGGIYQLKGK